MYENYPDLILFGLPGSGKTTLVQEITKVLKIYKHLDICNFHSTTHERFSKEWLNEGYEFLYYEAAKTEEPVIIELSGRPHWSIPKLLNIRSEKERKILFWYLFSPLEKCLERLSRREIERRNPLSDMKRKFSEYTPGKISELVKDEAKKLGWDIPFYFENTGNLEKDKEKIAEKILKRISSYNRETRRDLSPPS